MKRTVTEVLRRGFDSTIANWPVIMMRIAETVLTFGILIVSVLIALIPAVVAAGLSKDEILNSADPGGAVLEWIAGHVALIVLIIVFAFLVFGVLIAFHAFFEGASTQIYVDGERAAKKQPASVRDAFRAFSFDRFLAGGASSWWRIFWVYNLAWSVSLIFVLVPLIITVIALFLVSDNGVRIAIGCSGVALAVLILIPVAIVTSIWTKKAITICVARAVGAKESLRLGWREFRADLGRHLLIALIMFAISIALNSLVSGVGIPFNLTEHRFPTAALMFAPIRIVAGFAQGIIGAAVSSCFLACFVSLTEER